MTNLTNLTPFPHKPTNEVPRDNLIIQIAEEFNENCQKQAVVGKRLAGKTNLLAQFARHYSDRSVSYFITEDPWTQRPYNFIYAMCYQLCEILQEPMPPVTINLSDLKSQFTALATKLNMKSKASRTTYFFVIDGLEWGDLENGQDRIIDNLPPTFPIGPYLLYSCQESKFDNLPAHIKTGRSHKPLPFNQSETEAFLHHVGFSANEAKEIHLKHKGNPGTLKAVYDAKLGDPTFSKQLALQEYDRVIEEQLSSFLSRSQEFVILALQYLSICPTGLSTNILANLLSTDEESLRSELEDSGASILSLNNGKLVFSSETVQKIFEKQIEFDRNTSFQKLLNHIERNYPDEEFLLTTLYVKGRDYSGLQRQLTTSSVLTTIENPLHGVSSVIQRLRSASHLAIENKDYDGLLKWSLALSAVKSYIEQSVYLEEIDALIAIGDSREALRKAYFLPDSTNRIRFIARVYSTMKARNERVSKESLQELESFVNSLDIKSLDKEIIEKLAIEIFPLLPDVSVALIDSIKLNESKNGVIELFSKAISEKYKKTANESEVDTVEKQHNRSIYSKIFSDWLVDKSFSELEDALEPLKATEAKEQLVRHWCRRNPASSELVQAISRWLDIIKSDYDFVITLKALRQVSDLLKNVSVPIRATLIRAFDIPRITSLDSPKQEWIRFNLNLAEGLAEIDFQESLLKVKTLYEQIKIDPLDLDVKSFCLARILSTVSRFMPDELAFRDQVEEDFNIIFYNLLNGSAEQFESLQKTLGAFVDFDLDYALVIASELNITQRRERAKAHIFRVALLNKGDQNIASSIKDILDNLEEGIRNNIIFNVLNEIQIQANTIAEENLKILYEFVKNFEDPSERAITLALLTDLAPSSFCRSESMNYSIDSWRKEEDLGARISVGFQLVEILAKVDLDLAKEIYQEVKDLFLHPGASLAIGNLGADYVSSIELAARAIAGLPTNLVDEAIETVRNWIVRIPSKKVQGNLFSKLASSLYRMDNDKLANEMVRTKILPLIKELISPLDRRDLISFSLPIIYRYDPEEAQALGTQLLLSQRDHAWMLVIIWNFANCFLGDHTSIDSTELKVYFDRPRLLDAIKIAQKLQQDIIIFYAVETITNIIQQSFSSKYLNPTQTLELLDELEKLVENKLPDPRNIKHEGFVILAESEIHRVRTLLFIQKKARQLSKSDVGKKWQNLCYRASQIPNAADRVFVMSRLSENLSTYDEKDKSRIVSILEDAQIQTESLSTTIDRLERLDTLAETWYKVGEKTKAEFVIELGVRLLEQFEGSSRDGRLKAIVQTAYAIGDSDLASEIVSQIDKEKLPAGILSTPQRTLYLETLRKQPTRLNEVLNATNLLHEREHILGLSADQILSDLVLGRGKIDHPQTLGDWLHKSHDLHPAVIKDILNWAIENWVRGGPRRELNVFDKVIELIEQMANLTLLMERKNIPNTIENSFAGLSSKFVVFRPGEQDKAKGWLSQWINTNVKKYMKICDPYFGIEQLEYLNGLPDDCLVFVVTTTKGNGMNNCDPESIRRQWRTMSKRIMPFTSFTIVSAKSEHRFHDRVIISDGCGLDIGPSLNGLGQSQQKITVLSQEEASELEHKYLKDMLDSTAWLMEHGEKPILFSVG